MRTFGFSFQRNRIGGAVLSASLLVAGYAFRPCPIKAFALIELLVTSPVTSPVPPGPSGGLTMACVNATARDTRFAVRFHLKDASSGASIWSSSQQWVDPRKAAVGAFAYGDGSVRIFYMVAEIFGDNPQAVGAAKCSLQIEDLIVPARTVSDTLQGAQRKLLFSRAVHAPDAPPTNNIIVGISCLNATKKEAPLGVRFHLFDPNGMPIWSGTEQAVSSQTAAIDSASIPGGSLFYQVVELRGRPEAVRAARCSLQIGLPGAGPLLYIEQEN